MELVLLVMLSVLGWSQGRVERRDETSTLTLTTQDLTTTVTLTTGTKIPASDCSDPCVVVWDPLTTTLTVNPSDATVVIADALTPLNVEFPAITTITTISLDPSTTPNSDVTGTPSLSFPLRLSLEEVTVTATTSYLNVNLQQKEVVVEEEIELIAQESDFPVLREFPVLVDNQNLGHVAYDTTFNRDFCINNFWMTRQQVTPDGPIPNLPSQIQPFDIIGCSATDRAKLINAFANAKLIADTALTMWPGSLAFTTFFPDVNYLSTFQRFASEISKVFDPNIFISAIDPTTGQPEKLHVRFACIDPATPFPQPIQQSGAAHKGLVDRCQGIGNVEGFQYDGLLAEADSGPSVRDPEFCLPSVLVCKDFLDTYHFLNDLTTDQWCRGAPIPNAVTSYNFEDDVDIDYSQLTTPERTANDEAYIKHFSTFASTLLHELTHLDQLARRAGRAVGGTKADLNTEKYFRSECRSFKTLLGLSPQDVERNARRAQDNAESYALAMHEHFFRKLCGLLI